MFSSAQAEAMGGLGSFDDAPDEWAARRRPRQDNPGSPFLHVCEALARLQRGWGNPFP
ncbi:hypothetical protein ACFQ0B_79430 [Nonomuraea thailandensis]